jgi:hypothetical protein
MTILAIKKILDEDECKLACTLVGSKLDYFINKAKPVQYVTDTDMDSEKDYANAVFTSFFLLRRKFELTFIKVEDSTINTLQLNIKYGNDYLGVVNETYLKLTKESSNLLTMLSDIKIIEEFDQSRFSSEYQTYRELLETAKKIQNQAANELYSGIFYQLQNWNMFIEESVGDIAADILELDLINK